MVAMTYLTPYVKRLYKCISSLLAVNVAPRISKNTAGYKGEQQENLYDTDRCFLNPINN